jgi:hypothetical protein
MPVYVPLWIAGVRGDRGHGLANAHCVDNVEPVTQIGRCLLFSYVPNCRVGNIKTLPLSGDQSQHYEFTDFYGHRLDRQAVTLPYRRGILAPRPQ